MWVVDGDIVIVSMLKESNYTYVVVGYQINKGNACTYSKPQNVMMFGPIPGSSIVASQSCYRDSGVLVSILLVFSQGSMLSGELLRCSRFQRFHSHRPFHLKIMCVCIVLISPPGKRLDTFELSGICCNSWAV